MGSKKTPQPRSPTNPNIGAYISLLRPQNIPASFGLVAAGALVSSHGAAALMDPKVMLTALAAALVAVGSCVLNDWFDLELDRQNKVQRNILTRGEKLPRCRVRGGGRLGMISIGYGTTRLGLGLGLVISHFATILYVKG
ncbi:unnamed protein product [Discosporangium mesarthrocarpum]